MTVEKLQKANELTESIAQLKMMVGRAEATKTERVIFGNGNGYNNECVCIDKNIIDLVRRIIMSETNAKIKALEEEFLAL